MIRDFQKIRAVEKVRHAPIHFTVLTFCIISAAVYVYLYSNLTFKTAILSTIIQNALEDLEALNNRLKFKEKYEPYEVNKDSTSEVNKDTVSAVNKDTVSTVNKDTVSAVNKDSMSAVNTHSSSAVNITSFPDNTSLLVIFTTFSDKRENYLVRNNTLKNWMSFDTLVRPVFFSEDLDLMKRVEAKGWDTMKPSKTSIGIPILKNMYLDVMKRYPSKFYAFANGDLLFTHNLVDTLLSILNSADVNQSHPMLIVGQRTNVYLVTEEKASTHRNIEATAKKSGKLFTPWGVDYFITNSIYPWDDCPDIVIGRIAYDNWLVLNANKQNHITIDATKTLLAVHQTTKAGNSEGHHKTNKDYNGNLLRKLYKRIDYGRGLTSCTRKFTMYVKQDIQIKNRKGC